MQCFRLHKDVERCVTSAKADNFTGGTVRIVDVTSGQNNLSDPQQGHSNVEDSYRERGFIMDTGSKNVRPVRVAANDQSSVPTQAGQLHFSAPTGHDSVPWSSEDHQRLGMALEKLKNRALAKQQDK